MNSYDFMRGPSGGLSYHLTALQYRHTLWAPFKTRVATWLESWSPQSTQLIIFGSSAGWTIPFEFLSRFETITIVEPDPIARALFLRRFAKLKKHSQLKFIKESGLLPWFAQDLPSDMSLEKFIESQPHAVVLFTNVLGQIPLIALPPHKTHPLPARKKLLQALQGRNWASYHDVFSSNAHHSGDTPKTINLEKFDFSNPEEIARLAGLFFNSGSDSSSASDSAAISIPKSIPNSRCNSNKKQTLDVIDHDTLWISQGRPLETCLWQIRPKRTHVIGFTHT